MQTGFQFCNFQSTPYGSSVFPILVGSFWANDSLNLLKLHVRKNIFFYMIIKDQLGRSLDIYSLPESIVSLVPSHTELIADLAGFDSIRGITKFCVHPANLKASATIIGGTKQLHSDKILALNPDIIFANKEENNQKDVKKLEKHFPVFVSDIKTLDDSIQFISQLGQLFESTTQANAIIQDNKLALEKHQLNEKMKAIYLIWKKPFMAVGGDTYINDIMKRLGFLNVFDHKSRYPETSLNEIQTVNPDVILLSSEPYPFNISDIQEFRIQFPSTKIILVNGEFFSWYGSRIPKLDSFILDQISP